MSNPSFKYILGNSNQLALAKNQGQDFLEYSDSMVFVDSTADCLNAELGKAKAVIWNSDRWKELEELSPVKGQYGWMLVSINIPIYINIKDISQLDYLSNIRFDGIYSEDLEILLSCQKKMKTLSS